MSEQRSEDQALIHYGPVYGVYGDRSLPLGHSLAACRPGPEPGTLTTQRSWVSCEKCKSTEAYRNGK